VSRHCGGPAPRRQRLPQVDADLLNELIDRVARRAGTPAYAESKHPAIELRGTDHDLPADPIVGEWAPRRVEVAARPRGIPVLSINVPLPDRVRIARRQRWGGDYWGWGRVAAGTMIRQNR